VPENAQHAFVPGLYGRVKGLNPVASHFVDQPMGQCRSYPLALPNVLDERRVLRPFVTRFADIAYDGDDLVFWSSGSSAIKPK
jgi:hypothetical protein